MLFQLIGQLNIKLGGQGCSQLMISQAGSDMMWLYSLRDNSSWPPSGDLLRLLRPLPPEEGVSTQMTISCLLQWTLTIESYWHLIMTPMMSPVRREDRLGGVTESGGEANCEAGVWPETQHYHGLTYRCTSGCTNVLIDVLMYTNIY